MSEVSQILSIFKELNANPEGLEVNLRSAATEEDVAIACLEADAAIEKRMEQYRSRLSPEVFKNMTEELQNKLRAKIYATARQLRAGRATAGE